MTTDDTAAGRRRRTAEDVRAEWQARVAALVAQAPPFTAAQRERVAAVIGHRRRPAP